MSPNPTQTAPSRTEGIQAWDANGFPIAPGDLIRSFHFIGARRKRHYLYHTVVMRDGELWMIPTCHLEATKTGGGGDCRIWERQLAGREIISGVDEGGRDYTNRPGRISALVEDSVA